MEQDRYSINNKLYILGIISLILALGLFFFSMYILPYLIWNLYYDVPDLVSDMIMFFENRYDYGETVSKIVTWMIFFMPSLIAGYISYYISNYIDDQILGLAKKPDPEETLEHEKEVKESLGLAAKIILLMVLIVVVVFLLQYIIQSTA